MSPVETTPRCGLQDCSSPPAPGIHLEVTPPPDGTPVTIWVHHVCFDTARDRSVAPDHPHDHGRIPGGARCLWCGRPLPIAGDHPYVFDAGRFDPPRRYWSHAPCVQERFCRPAVDELQRAAARLATWSAAGRENPSRPVASGPNFEFRSLGQSDLPLLSAWLARPHIRAWWPSPDTLAALREEYLPADRSGGARPYLAVLEGRPAGFIQSYAVGVDGDGWWPDRPGDGVMGIDQFLADGDRLGQGLGAAMIAQFTDRLFDQPSIRQLRVDPRPDNTRAIRCYAKVGFRSFGPITTPDGPALMMVLDRPA